MANCPNCGSDHIQMTQETNVNWEGAVAGWVMFGVVGGAVGAVTGEDRHFNCCLNCGTAWKAKDLYNTLQTIKRITGIELKLNRSEDRQFMDNFISEIGPQLELLNDQEKKIDKLLQEAEEISMEKTKAGCLTGGLITVIGYVILSSLAPGLVGFLILPPIVLTIFGARKDNANEKINEERKKEIKRRVVMEKKKIEKQFKNELGDFMRFYTVEDDY